MANGDYTDEQREHALAIYRDDGPAEAARQTGIPRGTISAWASRDRIQPTGTAAVERRRKVAEATQAARMTMQQRRAHVADLLMAEAERCVRDAQKPYVVHSWKDGELVTGLLAKPPALERSRLISAAGEAVERAQLLAGEATSRPELLADREARQGLVARLRDEVGERRQLLEARRADPLGEEESGA